MSDTTKYTWGPGMREVSGFGGSYEAACQAMVKAGCEWLDEHPEADPQFKGWKGIYGIIEETNDDAEALTKVVIDAAGGDATGAMHQATISSVLFIHSHSWEEFVALKSGPPPG